MHVLRQLPKDVKPQTIRYHHNRQELQSYTSSISMKNNSVVAMTFRDSGIKPYCIPSFFLPDSSLPSESKVFSAPCSFLNVKQLTTQLYHLQTKDLKQRYDKTIVERLQNYVKNTNLIVIYLSAGTCVSIAEKYTDLKD